MSVSVSGGLREMQSTWPAFKAAKNGRTKPLRLMLLLALAELFELRHVFLLQAVRFRTEIASCLCCPDCSKQSTAYIHYL